MLNVRYLNHRLTFICRYWKNFFRQRPKVTPIPIINMAIRCASTYLPRQYYLRLLLFCQSIFLNMIYCLSWSYRDISIVIQNLLFKIVFLPSQRWNLEHSELFLWKPFFANVGLLSISQESLTFLSMSWYFRLQLPVTPQWFCRQLTKM